MINSAEDKDLSKQVQDVSSNIETDLPKEINDDLEEGECTSDEEEVVPVVPEQIKKQENEEKKKDRKHRHRSRSRSRSRDRHKSKKKKKDKKHSAPKEEISEEEQKVNGIHRSS